MRFVRSRHIDLEIAENFDTLISTYATIVQHVFPPRMLRDLIRTMGLGPTPAPVIPKDFSQEQIALYRKLQPFTMTSIERVTSLISAVEYLSVNRIAGPILECGVWRGGSMMAVALTLLRLGDTSRDLFLLDTFEGMTRPTEKDLDIDGRMAADMLAAEDKSITDSVWCSASLDDVRHNLFSTGYPKERLHFIEGRVEETIPGDLPLQLALLRLDTDWYESTLHELRHLYPRLAQSGILIIDDYGHWDGAKRAVNEYFESQPKKPLLQRIDYTGRLVVKV